MNDRTKRWLAAGAIVAVAAAAIVLWSAPSTPIEPALGGATQAEPQGAAAQAITAHAVERNERVDRDAAPPVDDVAVIPPQNGVAPCAPYDVTFLVLDDAGNEVEGATVVMHEGEAADPRAVAPGTRTERCLATLTTDAKGEAMVRVERPWLWVHAHHPELGDSVEHALHAGFVGADRRVRLWLLRTVAMHGVALGADGNGVPFAVVTIVANRNSLSARNKHAPSQPFVADANGRFRFTAAAGANCIAFARSGELTSHDIEFAVTDGGEVVVPFRGLYKIVVQTPADPTTLVLRMREVEPVPTAWDTVPAHIAAPGRVEIELLHPGRYQLFGSNDRHHATAWSEVIDVVCSPQQRHPEVHLSLTAADGTFSIALPGRGERNVVARRSHPGIGRVAGQLTVYEPSESMRPPAPDASTDFSFEIRGAFPESFLTAWVSSTRFAEPRNQEFRAAASGVRARMNGSAPPAGLELAAIPNDPDVPAALSGPLPNGPLQHVVLYPATAAQLVVSVTKNGRPQRALTVALTACTGITRRERTDAEGRATFEGLTPGPCRVALRRALETIAERELLLAPGRNPELAFTVQ